MFTLRRFRLAAFAPLALALLLPAAAWAASPVTHFRDSVHRFEHTEHFPDDICGPRASTVTFVTTLSVHAITKGDTVHLQFVETGTYTVVFDDPTIEGQHSQFTDTIHWNKTAGGTDIYTETFHDFPGDIRIQYRYHITTVADEIRVEREVNRVSGCP